MTELLDQPLPLEVLNKYQFVAPVIAINTSRHFEPFHNLRKQSRETMHEFQGVMCGPYVALTAVHGPTQPLIVLAAYVPFPTEGTRRETQPTDQEAAELERNVMALPQLIQRRALYHHFHPGHGIFLSDTDIRTAASLRRMNVARGPLLLGVSDPTRSTEGIFHCETTIFYWNSRSYEPCYEEK
ncbi:hypothetical protein HY086_02450 [Candidatus Gottesmanbacteria bacterium]|nr:hypothetical protein [Candidatus Gottesmanbacteria bacterium]